jgi:CDGSH-type Zn-finger protein
MTHPACPQKAPYALELAPGDYWWCACGHSKSQPFCDGSHKGGPFSPVKFTVAARREEMALRLQAHRRTAVLRRVPQGARPLTPVASCPRHRTRDA